MSDRPIIMSAESVRAILAGRKTQTRRVARFVPLPGEETTSLTFSSVSAGNYCADGHVLCGRRGGGTWHQITRPLRGYAPGQRLWVRETWHPVWATEEPPPHGTASAEGWAIRYDATDPIPQGERTAPMRSPIYMPRWASRITLVVESVRVERVQAITEADACAEGCRGTMVESADGETDTARYRYRALWDSINGKRPGCSWADNPWVWAITFRLDGAP